MASKRYIFILLLGGIHASLVGLANLTRNDPYPLFSSVYPYSLLSKKQVVRLENYDYTYEVDRFRLSLSGYAQFADRAKNLNLDTVALGDIKNGRFNMLALFYDPPLKDHLFPLLGINHIIDCNSATPPIDCCQEKFTGAEPFCECIKTITEPKKIDPRREFGFFSIPVLYRKDGIRIESLLLLVERCFYSIGLRFQTGLANIRQDPVQFNDLTYQALGVTAPAFSGGDSPFTGTTEPPPATVTGVVPPYINPYTVPPCNPVGQRNCIATAQQFQPIADQAQIFSYDANCKKLVIENIMKQSNRISSVFGLDFNSYNHVGMEDARIELFWRHLVPVNENSLVYPRLTVIPFAIVGVALPLEKPISPYKVFAVPIGNNGHVSAGVSGGFTFNYLDTVDLTATAGFTHFFKKNYCNYRLPTEVKESGIFPYTADITMSPGTTLDFGLSINSYNFIDNFDVWFEYLFVNHQKNKVDICKSFIPVTSKYFKDGFLIKEYEDHTQWQSQLFNLGFNYNLSPNLRIGFFLQLPLLERNAYHSTTAMGTISFVY